MDIKEIALRIAESIDDGSGEQYFVDQDGWITEFAEALIAEIAKQNEPCAFLHEWFEYHPFGDTVVGEPFATITNDEKPFDSSDTVSPLFTFPPNKAQIEQETAEAIAKLCESLSDPTAECELFKAMNIENERIIKAIRNGAWKEFKK